MISFADDYDNNSDNNYGNNYGSILPMERHARQKARIEGGRQDSSLISQPAISSALLRSTVDRGSVIAYASPDT